jgi:hypothetical protein
MAISSPAHSNPAGMIVRLSCNLAQIALGPEVFAIASIFSMHQFILLRAKFFKDFFMAAGLRLCQLILLLLIAIREGLL